MSIDVAKRFPRTSLWEAYERSKRSERWIFHETICSSVTLLYGRSNVGKSYLVSSMLLSLLIEGREFLGMQPTDPTKLWKPAILWTDPGSDEEYSQRICDHLPEGESVEIPFFHLGRTTGPREWEALTERLLDEGVNIVVLDNLMGATGDTNDSGAVVAVFDGLTRLTNRGVPAVVVHHESEHGLTIPGAPPMGQSVTVQKSRTWIQARQSAKRKLRGGNTVLVIQSNALQQPQEVVAEPLAGPNYRLLNRRPWIPHEASEPHGKEARGNDLFDLVANDLQLCRIESGRGVGKALRQRDPERWRTDDAATKAFNRAKTDVGGEFTDGRWKNRPA